MFMNNFISMLSTYQALTSRQLENINKIKKIAKTFHKDAGTYKNLKNLFNNDISDETIVLEAGHQPNFLPHAGTWKKAFLLHFLREKLVEKSGKSVLSLFGFADYNLCTATLLYQNRIPALTKIACEKMGFKISGKDKWKKFDSIKKPLEKEWEREIERIKLYYKSNAKMAKIEYSEIKTNIDAFAGTMSKSYELAENFPDVNAFFFSKVCNEILGLNVLFFRYSDVQKERIFMDEWKKIIANIDEFNKTYNEVLSKRKFKDISPCEPNSFPFWYHCDCGGKVPLLIASQKHIICTGKCPSCNKNHEISLEGDNIEKHFDRMSMNAVARNLILSEGIGTTLFISGFGGGLRYGTIANEISKKKGFNLPITLTWTSKDYYASVIYLVTINNLIKVFGINVKELLNKEILNSKVNRRLEELIHEINRLEKESKNKRGETYMNSIKRYKGEYSNISSKIKITNEIINMTPSILDIFVSAGIDIKLIDAWRQALLNLDVKIEDEFYIIRRDVVYDIPAGFTPLKKDQIPLIYDNISAINTSTFIPLK